MAAGLTLSISNILFCVCGNATVLLTLYSKMASFICSHYNGMASLTDEVYNGMYFVVNWSLRSFNYTINSSTLYVHVAQSTCWSKTRMVLPTVFNNRIY
jgi:hypothetical protein